MSPKELKKSIEARAVRAENIAAEANVAIGTVRNYLAEKHLQPAMVAAIEAAANRLLNPKPPEAA